MAIKCTWSVNLAGEGPEVERLRQLLGILQREGIAVEATVETDDQPPWEGESQFDQPLPTPTGLKPLASVAQRDWARKLIELVEKGKKTELEVVTENRVSWAQLQHYANSPTEGLPVTKPKRNKRAA